MVGHGSGRVHAVARAVLWHVVVLVDAGVWVVLWHQVGCGMLWHGRCYGTVGLPRAVARAVELLTSKRFRFADCFLPVSDGWCPGWGSGSTSVASVCTRAAAGLDSA